MQISEICVKRPVFATVLNLFLIVMGFISYSHLQVRQYPNTDNPNIVVESEYPGANPKVVETQLTRLLESVFATIPGVDLITSQSSKDTSKISIEFNHDRNADAAASDVRDRLSVIKNQLPRGIPEPQISKSSSDNSACIILSFSSDDMEIDDVRDYVERFIKSKFEAIDGVGGIEVLGGNKKQMRTLLDPEKLSAYNLTPVEIYDAITRQHIQRPVGKIVSRDKEYMLNITGELRHPHEFNNLIIPLRQQQKEKLIRLGALGDTQLTIDDGRESVYLDGKKMVALYVKKQSTANPVELSRKVKAVLPSVEQLLPEGLKFKVIKDDADLINESIKNVYDTIFEATMLVVLIVFLFLWSFKATLIPLVTIPVSLIGTFILLEVFGFTINIFTLLALVLAVGLVVDDAIVVLENVHRYIEQGKTKYQAAIAGSREIGFSIVAMTITLAAAYLPIAFTPGNLGRSFREFALALAGSVIISGFIALTLSPMMCSFLLEKHKRISVVNMSLFELINFKKDVVLRNLDRRYAALLKVVLKYKTFVLSGAFVVFLLGVVMFCVLPSENLPTEDEGYIIIRGEGPNGSSMQYMEKQAQKIDELLKTIPNVKYRYLKVTTNDIGGYLELVPWNKRPVTSQQLANDHSKLFANFAEISTSLSAGSSGGGMTNTAEFVLQTNEGFDYLSRFGILFCQYLFQYGGMLGSPLTTVVNQQLEYNIEIDREKASATGVSVDDIVTAIEICFRGKKAGEVQRGNQRDEMFLQLESRHRQSIDDLSNILLRSNLYNDKTPDQQMLVPLSELVHVKKTKVPLTLAHHNQMLSFLITMKIAPGYTIGQVVNEIKQIKDRELPKNIYITFTGQTKKFVEDSKQLGLIFMLALLFVFLILAMQFESFIDPFIIMFSVPLAITGAVITLVIFKCSLNIYSQVGLVTLIGLITKHGILIVDFANKLIEHGHDVSTAVLEGAKLRLRPILMTTFAMVLGAIPLAFAKGIGSAARQQIGICIVGGMSIGTIFTLFFLPVIYVLFKRIKIKQLIRE